MTKNSPYFEVLFQKRSPLKVQDQNIFRQANNMKSQDKRYDATKKQTPTPYYMSLPPVPVASYDTTWSVPLYRDTSLLSRPSSSTYYNLHHESRWEIEDDNDSSNDGYLDLPEDFIPPRHGFPRNPPPKRAPPKPSAEVPDTTTPLPDGFVHLHDMDIVCGRGAPTLVHPGNHAYRDLVQKHEASYLCAKRSDKPVIATKLMETLKLQGARFVRRERDHVGGLGWIEMEESKIYEKVCQSLREGAPELRRKMLASDARKKRMEQRVCNQENCSPSIYSV